MKRKYCRCNICTATGSIEFALNPEDFHAGGFYKDPDPDRSGFICSECYESYFSVKTEWEINDELDGLDESDKTVLSGSETI